MSVLLMRAAKSAEGDPSKIAFSLAAYRRRFGLDEAELAAFLGCTRTRLYGLALCPRPQTDSPDFEVGVRSLAAYIGCDAGPLITLLRTTSSGIA